MSSELFQLLPPTLRTKRRGKITGFIFTIPLLFFFTISLATVSTGCDSSSPTDEPGTETGSQKLPVGTTWSYAIISRGQGLPSSTVYDTTTVVEYLSDYNGKQNVARFRSAQSNSGITASSDYYVKFESNGDISTHKVGANIDGKEYWDDEWIVSPYGSRGSEEYGFDTISSTGKSVKVEGKISYVGTETVMVLGEEYEGIRCETEQQIYQNGVEMASTTGEVVYVPDLGIEVSWEQISQAPITLTIESELTSYMLPE